MPLAIAWCRPARHAGSSGRPAEAVLVLVAVVGLTEVAFRGEGALTYVVFPALMWAALRFGQRGATLAVALAAGLTVWNTTHYDGPFTFESITRSVLSTQLYVAVAALSARCLAAVVSERERYARRLGMSRARLVEAGDAERRRLEHDLRDGAQQRLTAPAVRFVFAEAVTNAQKHARAARIRVRLAIVDRGPPHRDRGQRDRWRHRARRLWAAPAEGPRRGARGHVRGPQPARPRYPNPGRDPAGGGRTRARGLLGRPAPTMRRAAAPTARRRSTP